MHVLNSQQKEAIRYIDSPLLVLAGAGSGKTRVIIEKITYLIDVCGYAPSSILAVTFTNKSARAMKSRVTKHLENQSVRNLKISTFHTFGLNLFKKYHQLLGYKKNFSLLDEYDTSRMISEIAAQLFQINKQMTRVIKHQISLWKNNLCTPEMVILEKGNIQQRQFFEIYCQYQKNLKAYNAIDLDDLIVLPVKLLSQWSEVHQYWQQKINYILVDEYQDTNASQYKLLQLLSGVRHQFTVVGDDDQSIYSWRGAKPQNLSALKQDYLSLKVIKLEQNYRSSGRILHAANTLINHNPHLFIKKLWSEDQYGDPIRIILNKDEDDESQRIASEILSHKLHHQTTFKDYVVLIRGNYQAFLLERYFQLYKIPYAITGTASFFSKTEIKDLLAYCRLMFNPEDNTSFLRVINTPRREIGLTTLTYLAEYAQKRDISLFCAISEIGLKNYLQKHTILKLKKFYNFIRTYQAQISGVNQSQISRILFNFLDDIQYKNWLKNNSRSPQQVEKRFDNIIQLISWICNDNNGNLESFDFAKTINRMLLMNMIDQTEDKKDSNKVQISTIHAAKGLEFNHVYLMGLEEGILPHQQSIDSHEIEEERRLIYVAITRAKYTLNLTLTKVRKKFGKTLTSKPSRFINELPKDDITWVGKDQTTRKDRQNIAKDNIAALKKIFTGS